MSASFDYGFETLHIGRMVLHRLSVNKPFRGLIREVGQQEFRRERETKQVRHLGLMYTYSSKGMTEKLCRGRWD